MSRVSQLGAAAVFAFLTVACTKPAPEPPARDADPAIAALVDQIQQDSMNWQLHIKLASELRHKNRLEQAKAVAAKAFLLEPSPSPVSTMEMAKIQASSNDLAAAVNLVGKVEDKKEKGAVVDEVDLAETYAVLNDTASAFAWLAVAKQNKLPSLKTLADRPDFKNLQKDPRWAKLTGTKN